MFAAIKFIFKAITVVPLFVDLCNKIADAIRKYQFDKNSQDAIQKAKEQKDTSKLEDLTK